MLQAGDVFESARGTRIVVREIHAERISIERTMPPGTGSSPKSQHRHTETHETFELLDGNAAVLIDGRDHGLQRGAALTIPLDTAHANPHTDGVGATILQSVTPCPRAVEVYFTSWLQWLQEGKTDNHDEPTTLQLAAIAKEAGLGGTYIARFPVLLQKLGLAILGLYAQLRGTRAVRVPERGDGVRAKA